MDPARLLICFIDESNQFLPDDGETVVSFAGVTIDGAGVLRLSDRLDHLQNALLHADPRGPAVEFHAYDLFHRLGRWSSISPRQSIWAFEQVFVAISECSSGVIFRLSRSTQEEVAQTERSALISLLKQAEAFARDLDAYTLAVFDERRGGGFKHVIGLHHHISAFPSTERTGTQTRVIPPLCFAPSHQSRVLQAADMLAFVLRRRALIPNEASSKAQRAMNVLMHHLESASLRVSIQNGN